MDKRYFASISIRLMKITGKSGYYYSAALVDMCPEGNAVCSSSPPRTAPTSSPSGKRASDPKDEVYVDNLHLLERYLSVVLTCFVSLGLLA